MEKHSTRPMAWTRGQRESSSIFANHYMNGSLGLTMVLPGPEGLPNYLAYVNRTEADFLDGVLAPLIRWIIQGRIRSEAGRILVGLGERLEGS